MFYNNSLERIFRLGGKDLLDAEDEGYFEGKDEVNNNLEEKDFIERFEIFQSNIIQLWDILGSATL